MLIEITLTELEEHLEEYIERAHNGERFLIIDHNVMLVPTDDIEYERDIDELMSQQCEEYQCG